MKDGKCGSTGYNGCDPMFSKVPLKDANPCPIPTVPCPPHTHPTKLYTSLDEIGLTDLHLTYEDPLASFTTILRAMAPDSMLRMDYGELGILERNLVSVLFYNKGIIEVQRMTSRDLFPNTFLNISASGNGQAYAQISKESGLFVGWSENIKSDDDVGGSGVVGEIIAGENIVVDNTDPTKPIVSAPEVLVHNDANREVTDINKLATMDDLEEVGGVIPGDFYKLDGTQPIVAPFAGGNQVFSDASDAVVDNDLTTLGQVEAKFELGNYNKKI